MKRKVVFATGNEGKLREIRMILADVQIELLSLKEAGILLKAEENGSTFEENARIKARACREQTEYMVLADDSGLEIDHLGGEPGVYSARYLGEDTPYHIKNGRLLERMAGVPDQERTARFRCCIAAVMPDGTEYTAEGAVEGRIGYEERGSGGFGYDPIFYVPEFDASFAELDAAQKNAVSHRGRALENMKNKLLAAGVWERTAP